MRRVLVLVFGLAAINVALAQMSVHERECQGVMEEQFGIVQSTAPALVQRVVSARRTLDSLIAPERLQSKDGRSEIRAAIGHLKVAFAEHRRLQVRLNADARAAMQALPPPSTEENRGNCLAGYEEGDRILKPLDERLFSARMDWLGAMEDILAAADASDVAADEAAMSMAAQALRTAQQRYAGARAEEIDAARAQEAARERVSRALLR
jgi:hypothetical protein